MLTPHKYSGAGNDFVVFDGRGASAEALAWARSESTITSLCNRTTGFRAADGRIGADGVMILSEGGPGRDFTMEYFNSDGSGGMMCGNGGRCIVAFADSLGIGDGVYTFDAADGVHSAQILQRISDNEKIVRLQMVDVDGFKEYTIGARTGLFLNTGTRHFVTFVDDVEAIDIETEGKAIRWHRRFAPVGTNVNFVQLLDDGSLKVRTFEKGVEAETLACGTGLTACAIGAYLEGINGYLKEDRTSYLLHARTDDLSVDFVAEDLLFTKVHLTGPAREIV